MSPTFQVLAMLGGLPIASLVVVIALFSLARAAMADGGAAPATLPDDPVANIKALRDEILKGFGELRTQGASWEAAKKVTEERLGALEKALASIRVAVPLLGEGEDEEKKAARMRSRFRLLGPVTAMFRQRNGASRDEAWKGYEFEREVGEAAARAAMSSGDDPTGAYLISPETDATPITSLRPKTVVLQAGAMAVSPRGNPYRVPEVIAGASGSWIDNNSAPAESKPASALKQGTPKKYGMLVKVDRSLLAMGDPSVEGIVRDDLTKKMAEVIDLAALAGTGASGQPQGLLTPVDMQVGGAQVIAIGTNGGSLTFDLAGKMIGNLEDANALDGKLAFISHPKNRRRLKNERIAQYSGDTSGGVYIPGSPIMSDAQFQAAIGYPWLVTTQLSKTDVKGSSSDCSPVVFGNWEDLMVLKWGGADIRPLFELGATADQVWFVVFFQMDVIRRRAASFVAIRDARINGL